MAITAGLSVAQLDLVKKGGIKSIYLVEHSDLNTMAGDAAADLDFALTTSKMFGFEFELETANWNFSATSERGSTMVEHTIQWYIPNCSKTTMVRLNSLSNIPVLVLIRTQAGKDWLVGHSAAYAALTGVQNNQMYAMISSVEGDTGSAYSDSTGCTVTITARAGEMPAECDATTFTHASTNDYVTVS